MPELLYNRMQWSKINRVTRGSCLFFKTNNSFPYRNGCLYNYLPKLEKVKMILHVTQSL